MSIPDFSVPAGRFIFQQKRRSCIRSFCGFFVFGERSDFDFCSILEN